MRRASRLLAVPLLLTACANPPTALRGSFALTTVHDAQARHAAGERVRWGGGLVDTRPGRDSTCFEVVSRPLDRQARPVDGDETLGRFVACAPGFYDPAIYAPNRDVTVVGTLGEPRTRPVGEFEYLFPVVQADTVYLWPKPPEPAVYYDPWFGPTWWGPYPYWGWGLGSFVAVPVRPVSHPRPR